MVIDSRWTARRSPAGLQNRPPTGLRIECLPLQSWSPRVQTKAQEQRYGPIHWSWRESFWPCLGRGVPPAFFADAGLVFPSNNGSTTQSTSPTPFKRQNRQESSPPANFSD